jgi:hypothetical protein
MRELKSLAQQYTDEAIAALAEIVRDKAAAYVHPRLAAVTIGSGPEKPIKSVTRSKIVPIKSQPRRDLP